MNLMQICQYPLKYVKFKAWIWFVKIIKFAQHWLSKDLNFDLKKYGANYAYAYLVFIEVS